MNSFAPGKNDGKKRIRFRSSIHCRADEVEEVGLFGQKANALWMRFAVYGIHSNPFDRIPADESSDFCVCVSDCVNRQKGGPPTEQLNDRNLNL